MQIKDACISTIVLKSANTATLESLVSCGVLKKHKKGEHLFFDRTKVDNFYFIIDGIAALYKLNSKDEKKVIFIYGNGEMLNEVMIQDELSSANCELLMDSTILKFNKKDFIEIMSNDFLLSKAVMDSMALKIRRLYHQLKNTSNSMRLDKQIAAKLWKFSKDHGIQHTDSIEIGFDLPITYLADIVGSKRETVSRQVKNLTDKKLIYTKRNRFFIVSTEKLLRYFKEP